jgi:hypothetical protein
MVHGIIDHVDILSSIVYLLNTLDYQYEDSCNTRLLEMRMEYMDHSMGVSFHSLDFPWCSVFMVCSLLPNVKINKNQREK